MKEFNDLEVTQFTGLKDIKNNDIYEGDIVQSSNSNGTKYIVKWYDGGFVVSTHGFNFASFCYASLCDASLCEGLIKGHKLEVVGNKFQV